MIDINFNENLLQEVKKELKCLRLFEISPEIVTTKLNIVLSMQILKNQIELSKQLQEIEEKLPRKHSAFQPG